MYFFKRTPLMTDPCEPITAPTASRGTEISITVCRAVTTDRLTPALSSENGRKQYEKSILIMYKTSDYTHIPLYEVDSLLEE